MRLLTACVVATALSTATAKKKKRRRKVDARTEQQRLCDACMGLAEHAQAFARHRVDGALLLQIDEADLSDELGVASRLQRKRLLTAIRDLGSPGPVG